MKIVSVPLSQLKGIDSIKVPDDVKESVGDVKRQMDEVKDAFKGIKIK